MPKVVEYGPQRISSAVGGSPMASAPTASSVGASAPRSAAARQIGGPGPMKTAAPADSFGVAPLNPEAEGRGISNLGQGISNFAEKLQQFQLRVDTTAAEEALVAFEREKNQLFFDPENGYFNSQGKDAYDRAKPFTEELDAVRQKYAEKIESNQARQMFDKAAEAHITRAQQDVMRHASTQFNAWEAATINSRVENSLENAVLYWNDPDKRAVNLEVGRQSVIDAAMVRGDSPETLAESLQSFNSKFAVNTIEGALAQSANAAQVALASNKELLEGPDIVNIQSKIDAKFKVEENQRQSNTAVIMANSYVKQYGEQDNARSVILDRIAEEVTDPELQSKVTRETMYQLDARKRAESEAREASFNTAYDYLLSPGGSVDRLIADMPEVWDALTVSQKRQLSSSTAVTTDAAQWLEVMSLSPEQMAKVNPSDYVGVFSKSDLDTLRKTVDDAKEGGVEARIGQTIAAQTNQALESIIGTTRGKWKPQQKAQADAIHSTINALVAEASQDKGRKLTNDEYTKILDNFTRKYIIDESTNTVVSERQWLRNERNMSVTDIPAEDLTVLSDYLRQNGIPVTAENLIIGYLDASQ